MANFARALPWVLRHEGGWSNDPLDHGGPTQMGITLAVAQKHGIPDAAALQHITAEQVEAIYRADYWWFDGIDDQRVATKLLDIAINCGPSTAVRLAQHALVGLGAHLSEDGILGPRTTAALNAVTPNHMLDLLCQAAAEHYRGIVARNPQQVRFLKGWLNRAGEIPS